MKLKLFTSIVALLFAVGMVNAQPLTPVDGLTGVSVEPTFTYGGAAVQTVTITETAGGAAYTSKAGAGGTVSFVETDTNIPLSNGTTYYWTVSGTPGTEYHFTTAAAVTVTLGSPSNGATVYGSSVMFTWSLSQAIGNMKFKIQIMDEAATPANWASADIESAFQTATYYTASSLLAGKTYNWRVIVYNAGGEVLDYSSVYQFTTDGGAVTPTLTTPSNGATIYTETPTCYWTVNGAGTDLTYDIQFDDDGTFDTGGAGVSGDVLNTTNVNALFYTVPASNLVAGNQYWWRVRSVYKRGTGDEVNGTWTTAWSFTIAGGNNITIYPSSPSNGATVYTNDPYVYWYTSQYTSGIQFEVVYSLNAATVDGNGRLNNAPQSLGWVTDYYDQITGLSGGQQVWWQVRSKYNSVEATNYTTPISFTTNGSGTLLVPICSYPISGVTVYTTAPTLYWYVNGSSAGLVFDIEIELSTVAFDGTPTYNDVNALYKQLTVALTPGATYHWQVRSDNGSSTSGYSVAAGTFTVAGGTSNGYPVASYPVSNPTMYTNRPTLNWYLEGSSLGLTGYKVLYQTTDPGGSSDWEALVGTLGAPDATDGEFTIANINTTYWTLTTDLTYGQQYFWAVASYDGSGNSAWSEGSFTIVGGPTGTTVVLSQPGNGSTITTTAPTLYWYLNGSSLGITGYEVVYSKSDVFAAGVGITTTIAPGTQGTNMYRALSGLTAGATYYWKITPYWGATAGTVSSTWTFIVDNGSLPLQPLIGGPTNNITVNTDAPMLSWVLPGNTDNLTYRLEVIGNNETDWANATVIEGVSDPYAVVDNLQPGEYYKWRVSSSIDGNYPIAPNHGVFKVGDDVTSVEKDEVIPTEFTVAQNYPNPFNPTTTIKYGIPHSSFVSIKIYNLLGQEVRTLINTEKDAGTFEVVWAGDDNFGSKVASGTYIYRVIAGERIVTKKMVLLK